MGRDAQTISTAVGAMTFAIAAAVSVAVIIVMQPLLGRVALAKPNARSSHTKPTPQGGGIAVVAGTILATCATLYLFAPTPAAAEPLLLIFVSVILIGGVGAADDIQALAVAPRLLLQSVAVTVVVCSLPQELRVLPFLPDWSERILLILAGVWFVNLVNFMDGIDLMTAVEVLPIAGSLVIAGVAHALPQYATVLAIALGGSTFGFAYFNRPVARIFLGDVGSLPIGLMLGWLLCLLAGGGHLTAAIIMPLYYLADTGVTLIRRLARGEVIWNAHRAHFYQLATERGFSVTAVILRVFLLNVGLGTLALITVFFPGKLTNLLALFGAGAAVAALLVLFSHGRKIPFAQT